MSATKRNLTVLALAALVALVGVSVWATQQQAIGAAIGNLVDQPRAGNNPWFIATLFDTYFGFLWFYAWVAYRERSGFTRLLWLPLILLLGNLAMASYMLIVLWRLPPDADARAVLLRPDGPRR